MSLRRAVVGCWAAIGVAVMIAGSAAYACVTPATLNLSSAAGRPGETITASGSAYKVPEGATTGIQIRWTAPDGPLLAEAWPDSSGNFSAAFTVPEGGPGFYVIAAVLRDKDGNDVAGTPARALFEIRNVSAPTVPAPVANTFTPSSGPSGSSTIALVVGLGVAGLLLFSAGFIALARSRRRAAPMPAPSPVRRH